LLWTLFFSLSVIFAAPIIGLALMGSGFGLFTLATANHSLALIGISAIQPVQAGMMGGRWVISGVGSLSKSLLGGKGTALGQVGSATAILELAKLQVYFREFLMLDRANEKKANETISKLEQNHETILNNIQEEMKLNEKMSVRVKELKDTAKAVKKAADWMRAVYEKMIEEGSMKRQKA
jgi:hypothetical protein